ncbi:MAG: hypothetical protein ACSLFM_12085 [Tepidiformaceae bacterium]
MLNLILSDPEMAQLITGKPKRLKEPDAPKRRRESDSPESKPHNADPVRRGSLLGRLRDALAGE